MLSESTECMGGSSQMKVVSEILQSIILLPYKLLRKNSNPSHPKGFQASPSFSFITLIKHNQWKKIDNQLLIKKGLIGKEIFLRSSNIGRGAKLRK